MKPLRIDLKYEEDVLKCPGCGGELFFAIVSKGKLRLFCMNSSCKRIVERNWS